MEKDTIDTFKKHMDNIFDKNLLVDIDTTSEIIDITKPDDEFMRSKATGKHTITFTYWDEDHV